MSYDSMARMESWILPRDVVRTTRSTRRSPGCEGYSHLFRPRREVVKASLTVVLFST